MVIAKGTAGNFSNTGGTKGSGCVHAMACISMIDSGEISLQDGRIFIEKLVAAKEKREEAKVALNTCSSSSTSSIGKNSDISGRSKENSVDADEVQSSYKSPLDAMEALEQVLPMRRGISSFYNGKSKSFACLTDAPSTSSIKELAKPENAYIRKRRNLLASNLVDNKNRNSPLKSNGGGVSKRVTNANRSTLALAVNMSSSSGNSNNDSDNFTSHYPAAILGSPSWHLRTRLHSQLRPYYQPNGSSLSGRRDFSAGRSLSLADLQHCVSITATCTSPTPSQLDTNGSST